MNKIKLSLFMIIGLVMILLSSCNSSQTFTVQGLPGTIISSPDNQQLAVVDNSGQAQIKLVRKEGYYHYLQAQMPGSSLQVPFALDYKNHSRAMKRGLLTAGTGAFALVTFTGTLMCGASVLAGSDEILLISSEIVLGGSIGCLGFGWPLGNLPAKIDSDYDYLKHQLTNSDILR